MLFRSAMNILNSGKSNLFLSKNFIDIDDSFIGIMGVFALLDLPAVSTEHGFHTTEGRSAELKAATNLILFKKEIKESNNDFNKEILVAQRYSIEDEEEVDYKIQEFLVNKVYRGKVIISNASSKKLNLDLLIQIPQGSLPLGNSLYQRSYSLTINPYTIIDKTYNFYFPNPGKFKHYPANVSVNSVVIAKATTETLIVVEKRTKIDHKNFKDIVSTNNHNLIIKYLRENPIDGIKEFSWDYLYWMLKDKTFFDLLANLMKEQHRYDDTLWSYSLLHKHREDMIIEYLNSDNRLKSQCGYYFDSGLLKVRPCDSDMWHLDYYPLINPRAHKNLALVNNNQPLILNEEFYKTYKRFIIYLLEKPKLDLYDKINLAYYFILQDRINEAISVFSQIDFDTEISIGTKLKLQYDYMDAYLDFYRGAPEYNRARNIVLNYINHPISSWRLLFIDMDQQLKEYDGLEIEEKLDIEEEERKERSQKKLLKSEPQFDISLNNKEIGRAHV